MDMDLAALMDSEVMMNYLRGELVKKAACHLPQTDLKKVLRDFEDFESAVKKNPQLRFAFLKLQEKFKDDPEYTSEVEPSFVEGVMLLDLGESQST